MVDISSKSLKMVIDFPNYLKYDEFQDLKSVLLCHYMIYQHVGHRWSSSLSRSQKRLKWREVKKVVDPPAPAARIWKCCKSMFVCCAGADDDDEARSEATFRFRVENFSTIKDSTLSESCVIR